jgi:hypothetical protein
LDIVQTTHRFLLRPNFRELIKTQVLKWNYNILYQLIHYPQYEIKWNCLKCICILGNYSYDEFNYHNTFDQDNQNRDKASTPLIPHHLEMTFLRFILLFQITFK